MEPGRPRPLAAEVGMRAPLFVCLWGRVYQSEQFRSPARACTPTPGSRNPLSSFAPHKNRATTSCSNDSISLSPFSHTRIYINTDTSTALATAKPKVWGPT